MNEASKKALRRQYIFEMTQEDILHPKLEAVLNYLDDQKQTPDDPIIVSDWDDCVYLINSMELMVLDETERDMRWDESLQNYIDECILPEMPSLAQNYFDDAKWKRDAMTDGAGHALSSYDGNEYEYKIDGESYYVYRIN